MAHSLIEKFGHHGDHQSRQTPADCVLGVPCVHCRSIDRLQLLDQFGRVLARRHPEHLGSYYRPDHAAQYLGPGHRADHSAQFPTSSPGLAAAPTGASTFLAAAQSLNGTLLHQPACGGSGCALSGDSTAFLFQMKWTIWSGSEAVGTGTYKLDDCSPNCAAGHVYSLATVVTLNQPVKMCSSSGTRWVWTHAFFIFPQGLPAALTGPNAPQNPWTFSGLVTAAQQTCAS
jgi:hypothetical protein